MNEEYAERILISLKEKHQTNDLKKEHIDTLLNLTQDLLQAYIKEKYKSY